MTSIHFVFQAERPTRLALRSHNSPVSGPFHLPQDLIIPLFPRRPSPLRQQPLKPHQTPCLQAPRRVCPHDIQQIPQGVPHRLQ